MLRPSRRRDLEPSNVVVGDFGETIVIDRGLAKDLSAAERADMAGRSEVRLPGGPIRLVGEHHVKLHLHADVEIDLPVVITAEE